MAITGVSAQLVQYLTPSHGNLVILMAQILMAPPPIGSSVSGIPVQWTELIQQLSAALSCIMALLLPRMGASLAAQVFRCFAGHGGSSPLMAGVLVVVQPDELPLAFQMWQQATFKAVPLDPRSCPGLGSEAVHIWPYGFFVLLIRSALIIETPMSTAEDLNISHGGSIAGD